MTHIVVIGGGIAGLSAAWEIQKRGQATFSLLEASERWGGKVHSRTLVASNGDKFLVDGGPESFVTRKPEVWELAHELGLADELVNPGSETRNIYVLDGGRPYPIPLSPALFFSSPLMTWRGKLRLLAEPFQPARRDTEDESLAAFGTRRLGREALEKFIGPVLGGIYNTDPAHQSILVSSPVMREMEAESGSLVLAALKRAFRPRPKDGRPSFVTFKHGAQVLTDAMAAQLKGDLRLNAEVTRIQRDGAGYCVMLSNGDTIQADKIILAILASQAAGLLRETAPQAASQLDLIQHNHIGTVSLVFRESDLPQKPVVNGLMIPRREKRAIDAVTFTSRKTPQRAAPGFVLLRVYLGGARPDVVEMDDAGLVAAVCAELGALLGIHAKPLDYTIFRWLKGFPQANVGHLGRVAQVEALLPAGIGLAGSSYRGIAVPDCIKQGREIVQKLLQ